MQQANNYRSNNQRNNNRYPNGKPNGGRNGPQQDDPNSLPPLFPGFPTHVLAQLVQQRQMHQQMHHQQPINPQIQQPPIQPLMQYNQMDYRQNGPPNGPPNGLLNGPPNGLLNGPPNGLLNGPPNGLLNGPPNGLPLSEHQIMIRYAGANGYRKKKEEVPMVPYNNHPAILEKGRNSIESRESGYEESEVRLIAEGIVQTPDGIVRFRHLKGQAYEIMPEVGEKFMAFDDPVKAIENMYINARESVRKQLALCQEQLNKVTNELRDRIDQEGLLQAALEDLERKNQSLSIEKEKITLTIAELGEQCTRLTRERNDGHKEIDRLLCQVERLKMDNKMLSEANANPKNAVTTVAIPESAEIQLEKKETEKKEVGKTVCIQEDPQLAAQLQAEKNAKAKEILKKQAEDRKKAELLNRQRKTREAAESRARAQEMKRQQAEEARKKHLERAAELAAKKAEEKLRAEEEAAKKKAEKERLDAEKKEAKAQNKLRKKIEQKEKKIAQAEKKKQEKLETEMLLKNYKTEVDNVFYTKYNLPLTKQVTHGDNVQSTSDRPSNSDQSQKPGEMQEGAVVEQQIVEEQQISEDDEDLSSELEEPSLNAEVDDDECSGSPERCLGRNLQLFNMNGMIPKDV